MRIRKILVSLTVSAGILAITNIENILQQYHQTKVIENFAKVQRLGVKVQGAKPLPLESDKVILLQKALEGDELADQNLMANLQNIEPLQKMFARGIKDFHRQAYRSQAYHDETGYDLVVYQIEQTDGGRSSLLEFLDNPQTFTTENLAPVPFLIVVVSGGSEQDFSLYREGDLIQHASISVSEAQRLVSQKINNGMPFLSVSR